MTEEIIIAGFGGQGVLSMGKILAYSGIMQAQEVSWMHLRLLWKKEVLHLKKYRGESMSIR